MGHFEATHIYPRIANRHRSYVRFKDDIFLIWTDGEESLKQFIKEINEVHTSIKFECNHSRHRINFLDTYITLNPDGSLSTSLYSKPTDRNAYLHFHSYHPPKQIHNIPYGQFLRAKKISSTAKDASEAMSTLEKRFQERGYPKSNTAKLKAKAAATNRDDLLQDKTKTRSSRTPFTTTFNKHHPPIQHIINKHWHILQTSKDLATAFTSLPVVAYRRTKT